MTKITPLFLNESSENEPIDLSALETEDTNVPTGRSLLTEPLDLHSLLQAQLLPSYGAGSPVSGESDCETDSTSSRSSSDPDDYGCTVISIWRNPRHPIATRPVISVASRLINFSPLWQKMRMPPPTRSQSCPATGFKNTLSL